MTAVTNVMKALSDPNALNGVYNTPYAPPGYYK